MYWTKRNRTPVFFISHDNSAYDHNNEVLEYTNESRTLYIRANLVFREYKNRSAIIDTRTSAPGWASVTVLVDIQKCGGGCDHFCDFGKNGARSV